MIPVRKETVELAALRLFLAEAVNKMTPPEIIAAPAI